MQVLMVQKVKARHRQKEFEVNFEKEQYVLDRVVNVNKVKKLILQPLVGCLEYIKFNKLELMEWVSTNSNPIINYTPKVSI